MKDTLRRRVLVMGGDSMASFSGSSYYFTQDLAEELPDFAVDSIPIGAYRDFAVEVVRWGLTMWTDPRKYFFMMQEFQDANARRVSPALGEADILISFTTIAPRKEVIGGAKIFLFLDMTHHQYLGYSQFHDIPDRIRKKVFQQERDSYRAADRIFAFTDDVRMQLLEHYGVPDDKIEVIGRGLNLPPRPHASLAARPNSTDCAGLRVGFVGYDFARKGLPELIEAVDGSDILRERVEIEVIGPDADALPSKPYLRAHGYLSKDTEIARICEIMASCDVGYLFSKSEGVPGSVLEFLSMGVPCIISDIPAMASMRSLPGIIHLPLDGGATAVAEALERLVASPSSLHDLRQSTLSLDFDGWRPQARAVSRWCRAVSPPLAAIEA